ncbi:hypothetical protein [Aurantiacibacter zhengii]
MASRFQQTSSAPASSSGRFNVPKIHEFRDSLALSEKFTDAPWWHELYLRAFPTMISAVSVRQDGWAQRGGIDRVITLASGRVYTVDEKVRMNDWPDILLERWSDAQRGKPGWIQKPLACDFIAYAFAPSRRCYLLPVAPLQRAWRLNGRHWIEQYGERFAMNPGYRSSNVPVPIETLMGAIAAAMVL